LPYEILSHTGIGQVALPGTPCAIGRMDDHRSAPLVALEHDLGVGGLHPEARQGGLEQSDHLREVFIGDRQSGVDLVSWLSLNASGPPIAVAMKAD